MELFLMRHGHAFFEAPKDSLRELSEEGRGEVLASVEGRKPDFCKVEQIIASPYIRAQQTAALVQGVLGHDLVATHAALVPQDNPDAVVEYLYERFHTQAATSLFVVSHQPLLGILLNTLCGLDPAEQTFTTATIAALDIDVLARGCCTLRWIHHPG